MRKFLRCDSGQTFVEYGILYVSVIVPLTFAILFLAELLWVWHSVVDYTRDGARYASTHCWESGGQNVIDYMRSHVPLMIDMDQFQQGQAQIAQQAADVVDGAAQVEADVGGHLVVARTAGVQALAGVADQLGQALLDVEVDVFQVQQPFKLAARDFALDLGHALLDRGIVVGADDFLICQHLGMRQRALDIDLGQALVEKYRRRVTFDQIGDRFGETSRPSFAFFGELCCHN